MWLCFKKLDDQIHSQKKQTKVQLKMRPEQFESNQVDVFQSLVILVQNFLLVFPWPDRVALLSWGRWKRTLATNLQQEHRYTSDCWSLIIAVTELLKWKLWILSTRPYVCYFLASMSERNFYRNSGLSVTAVKIQSLWFVPAVLEVQTQNGPELITSIYYWYYTMQFGAINGKHRVFLLGSLAACFSLSPAASLEVLRKNSAVTDTGVHELYFLCHIAVVRLSLAFCVFIFQFWRCSSSQFVILSFHYHTFFLSLLLSPARPLPSWCGLSDLPVNSCGYSELCLCYWKHPSNTPISHDVKMIGCALFGYPFPIAGHDWRELLEMMG